MTRHLILRMQQWVKGATRTPNTLTGRECLEMKGIDTGLA